jgi:hypothetical protein
MTPFAGPSRRSFLLGTLQATGALAGLGGLFRPAIASDLRKAQKRAILVWMGGGRPTSDEVATVKEHLKAAKTRADGCRDFAWALIAGAEFRFNH